MCVYANRRNRYIYIIRQHHLCKYCIYTYKTIVHHCTVLYIYIHTTYINTQYKYSIYTVHIQYIYICTVTVYKYIYTVCNSVYIYIYTLIWTFIKMGTPKSSKKSLLIEKQLILRLQIRAWRVQKKRWPWILESWWSPMVDIGVANI